MSQSSISHSLARLREFFDDPLFIKTQRGVTATPKSESLAPVVQGMMATLREQIFAQSGFSPTQAMPAAVARGAGEALVHLVRLSLGELGGQATLRDRIHDHIALHLRDPRLDPGHIAAALGCSTRQLHKVFAAEDTSLARCIQRRRLEGCRQELRSAAHAHRSVTDIALSWGFNNAAHFSRLFRAQVGMPPSQYRHAAG